jgi:hypothetical protein
LVEERKINVKKDDAATTATVEPEKAAAPLTETEKQEAAARADAEALAAAPEMPTLQIVGFNGRNNHGPCPAAGLRPGSRVHVFEYSDSGDPLKPSTAFEQVVSIAHQIRQHAEAKLMGRRFIAVSLAPTDDDDDDDKDKASKKSKK